MTKTDVAHIEKLLSTPKKCVIVPHKNPDGDAMGSTLALYDYLIRNNHECKVIAPNDYPKFLKWLPHTDSVLIFENDTEKSMALINSADLIFTLDFNALHRTGETMASVLAQSTATKIMIDHHQQPDDYAIYMYSDTSMSSTCEMVFNFIKMLGDEAQIEAVIATCLYTGIMTDTGSFRFPSTTSTTHRIIASLIDKGAKHSQIHNNIYDTNSQSRLQLLGCALKNIEVLPTYRTAFIKLAQSDLDAYQFKKGDTEGFVNYALSLEGIIFAVIFIENRKEHIIKISFRSKGDFSVNQFARMHFNGGGHTNAAGGKSDLNLQATIDKFISILSDYKSQLT